jgi:plasmid stabilization system protein ParE
MFRVVVTEPAVRDLQAAHDWWAENRSRMQAERWYRGILAAMRSLAIEPGRCAEAAESQLLSLEIREHYFGLSGKRTHRIIFGIEGRNVVIYRVRHVAQDYLHSL